MRAVVPAVLLTALFVTGCAKTLPPEEFLFRYRHISPPQAEERTYADYEGEDARYHYLLVRHSNYHMGKWAVRFFGAYRKEHFRCPKEQLPPDFPEDFDQSWTESPDDARQYVKWYLRQDHAWRQRREE